jgi:hypothetical protein
MQSRFDLFPFCIKNGISLEYDSIEMFCFDNSKDYAVELRQPEFGSIDSLTIDLVQK